jgi:hypothetical protein
MSTSRSMAILGLTFVCHLVAILQTRAESYRDKERHFTLELPQGWQVMTDQELAQINQAAQSLGSPFMKVQYVQGFRPKGSALGSLPYTLVKVMEGKPTGSYEDIESSLARELPGAIKKAEGSLTNLVKDVSVGSAILDRDHNRVIFRVQMTVAGIGPAQAISVGHIGSDGVIFILSYAKESDFDKYLPTFTKMNDSFEYDKGHTFTPSENPFQKLWQGMGMGALGGAVKGAIGGAIFGVLVGTVIFVIRGLKKE